MIPIRIPFFFHFVFVFYSIEHFNHKTFVLQNLYGKRCSKLSHLLGSGKRFFFPRSKCVFFSSVQCISLLCSEYINVFLPILSMFSSSSSMCVCLPSSFVQFIRLLICLFLSTLIATNYCLQTFSVWIGPRFSLILLRFFHLVFFLKITKKQTNIE